MLGGNGQNLNVRIEYVRFVSLELLYLGMDTPINAVFQGSGNTRTEMAIELIIDRIKDSSLPPRQIMLPMNLVVRESTGPVKKLL